MKMIEEELLFMEKEEEFMIMLAIALNQGRYGYENVGIGQGLQP